ncbi:hypothetical protein ACFTXJ_15365 [Streptomyces zhihengii]
MREIVQAIDFSSTSSGPHQVRTLEGRPAPRFEYSSGKRRQRCHRAPS